MSAANCRAKERQTTVNRAVPCVVKSRLFQQVTNVHKYHLVRKYEREFTALELDTARIATRTLPLAVAFHKLISLPL